MKRIGYIRTDFPDKFGVPRQSGLINNLTGKIIFEPEFRNADALRGLDGFSHIWILWEFDSVSKREWSPMVRPPRLGGNKRVGVFATRSPNRPNPIGLSSVKLEKIEITDEGPVLTVSGIDMMDGTSIYDIKPYLPYVDCHVNATDGFAADVKEYSLKAEISDEIRNQIPRDKLDSITEILKSDPRPSYQKTSDRIYGMRYADLEIKFKVEADTARVISCDTVKKENEYF